MAKDATAPADAPVLNKDAIKAAPAPQPISEVLKPAESAPSSSPSAESSKRRARSSSAKRGRKSSTKKAAKQTAAEPEILFLVETEEGSETFKLQEIATTGELLDVLDDNRQIIATRNWREF